MLPIKQESTKMIQDMHQISTNEQWKREGLDNDKTSTVKQGRKSLNRMVYVKAV